MIFNDLHNRSRTPRANVSLGEFSATDLRESPHPLDEHTEAAEQKDDSKQESDRKIFASEDFVFLSDNVRCWVVRASDISTLEACGNYTRVTLSGATALIRRPLRECEGRLDPATFFRTRRDCIVNLSRVRQMRMLDAKRFLFVLLDGKEVPMSRKQSLLFRKQKAL
jgi:two-component system, LytTR family, response regulator